MLRAPHFAHAALAEPFDEAIAAEVARAADFLAQLVDDPRTHVSEQDDEQVGKHDPEEELVAAGTEDGAPVRIM